METKYSCHMVGSGIDIQNVASFPTRKCPGISPSLIVYIAKQSGTVAWDAADEKNSICAINRMLIWVA